MPRISAIVAQRNGAFEAFLREVAKVIQDSLDAIVLAKYSKTTFTTRALSEIASLKPERIIFEVTNDPESRGKCDDLIEGSLDEKVQTYKF